MEQKPTTGTSIEVLAAYLPYGIEVEVCRSKRGTLVALPMGQISQRIMPDVLVPVNGPDPDMYSLGDVMPVLKPFSQLCDPLPDGTVPLIEVAKLAWHHFEKWRNDGPIDWQAVRAQFGGACDAIATYTGEECCEELLSIYDDWAIQQADGNAIDCHAILTYLRSQHFAVGLASHQYISAAPPAAPVAAAPAGKGGAGV